MRRALTTALWIALICSTAGADRLVLRDGRVFIGTVTVAQDVVYIDVSYGTLEFARGDVVQIEFADTPEAALAKRLKEIEPNDARGLAQLAQWARENGLVKQSTDLYEKVLTIDADHAEARRVLGFVRVDDQWMPFQKALQLARSKLEAGRYDDLLAEMLPALDEAATTDKATVSELRGLAQLRDGQFAEAGKTFAALAKAHNDLAGYRWQAIADILQANPDGMYVLDAPYPPAASLLNPQAVSLKAGPASLTHPLTLQAALRERAKIQIQAGQEFMESASKLESTDPAGAKTQLAKAQTHFDQADSLVEGIARSYRVEIARRQIASIRKELQAEVTRYDQEESQLGTRAMSGQEYRTALARMIRRLDRIRDGYNSILQVAKPFPRDLVMEIKWTENDLQKIEAKRKILLGELQGRG